MRSLLRSHVGRPVVVGIDDYQISGTLTAVTATELSLSEAVVITDAGKTSADGFMVIDRLRADWVQVL